MNLSHNMKLKNFTLQTQNYPVFLFSILNTILQSCKESPFFMIPIIITVFIWANISKAIAIRSNQSIDKVLASRNITNAVSLLFLMMLDCVSKSVTYWLRPLFETRISNIIEFHLFGEYLKLNFEQFYEYGPALNSAILFKHVSKITKISTLVLFHTFDSFAGVNSSLRFLYKSFGSSIFMKFVMSLVLICIIEAYLFSNLAKLKRTCIEIEDARAEDITECFENILISASVNEKDRMNVFFTSNTVLKYSIILRSIKITRQIVILGTIWYMLAENRLENPVSLIRELSNASNSVQKFVNLFFELESSRIELADQKIFNPRITNESINDCGNSVYNSINDRDNSVYKSIVVENCNDSILRLNDISIFFRNSLILKNVSLRIKEGDKIVLFGKNGSGKSTFLKFLLGFLRYSGTFESSEGLDFSYIPQNTFLSGTIQEEISKFCKCNEEIFKACRMFDACDFISSLERGFQTDTRNLNESQRQLVKIIQGMLKPSKILLVDEPTTGLNDELGEKVLDLILESKSHSVKIVILHEKRYLSKFDRVFLFENQRIKTLAP